MKKPRYITGQTIVSNFYRCCFRRSRSHERFLEVHTNRLYRNLVRRLLAGELEMSAMLIVRQLGKRDLAPEVRCEESVRLCDLKGCGQGYEV